MRFSWHIPAGWGVRAVLVMSLALLAAAGGKAAQDAGGATGRIECGAFMSRLLRRRVGYCAFLPGSITAPAANRAAAHNAQARTPVLYYLHGLGDNERSLLNTGAWNLVEDLRQERRIGDFLIVTPAAGDSFYVNSRDGRQPYSDFFLKEFIPFIERRYHARSDRAGRAITGFSMGGYGSLRFAFANPRLFSAASAISPALVRRLPQQLNNGAAVGFFQAAVLTRDFGKPLDMHYWEQNTPFTLAARNAGAIAGMKIEFRCGREDNYGFDQGAEELAAELKKLKIAADFHLDPGAHDVGYFLQHFGSFLEFHSQAFGAKPR